MLQGGYREVQRFIDTIFIDTMKYVDTYDFHGVVVGNVKMAMTGRP
jgi:hypothetical protein